MKYKDIEIDGLYWCKVGGKWTVVVVQACTNRSLYRGGVAKFIVSKANITSNIDDNSIRISLPKPRSPNALHPYNAENPVPPDFSSNIK